MSVHAFTPGEGNVPRDAHPDIVMLVRYWQYLRWKGRLPGRAQFNLDEISVLRPNMRLLDIVPGGSHRYRVRMIGDAHKRQLGFDPTGRWYETLISWFPNSIVELDLTRVCHWAEPVYRKGQTIVPYASGAAIVERVHVPLARDGTTVDTVASLTLFLPSLQQRKGPRLIANPAGETDDRILLSPEPAEAIDFPAPMAPKAPGDAFQAVC
jgi:hypothetical protein